MCLIKCSSSNLKYITEQLSGGGMDGSKVVSIYECTKCGKKHLFKENR